MFSQSAHLYDAIYRHRADDDGAARRLRDLIRARRRSAGFRLMDVACGTGADLPHLQQEYEVEGLDLDEGMLAVARARLPGIRFHHADMTDFDLGRRFDLVTCFFTSIGYAKTLPRMRQTVANIARHTLPGGVVAVKPWFSSEPWVLGHVSSAFVDRPDLKIARMSISEADGALSFMDLRYLVATREGVEHFVERHELGLFAHEEYLDAFAAVGPDVSHDADGPIGRGLYLGVRRPDGTPDPTGAEPS